MVLVLVVYMGLVSALVARREELVLKRLRTGEATDLEILGGAALPSAAIALVQCVVLSVGGALVLDVPAPRRPDLLVLGLLAAILLLAGLAAATTAMTRNVESAGLTTLPFFLISAMGSGLMVPRDLLPDLVASLTQLLAVQRRHGVRPGRAGSASATPRTSRRPRSPHWPGVLTVFFLCCPEAVPLAILQVGGDGKGGRARVQADGGGAGAAVRPRWSCTHGGASTSSR
ncbi:hypothetical protein STENM327S_01650 [Streptomyces tendae]